MAFGNWMRASIVKDKGRDRKQQRRAKEAMRAEGEGVGQGKKQVETQTQQHPLATEPGQDETQPLEPNEEDTGMDVCLGIERHYPTEFIGLYINEDETQLKSQVAEKHSGKARIRTGGERQHEMMEKQSSEDKITYIQTAQENISEEQQAQSQTLNNKALEGSEGKPNKIPQGSMATAHIQIVLNKNELEKQSGLSHKRSEEGHQQVKGKTHKWKRRPRNKCQQGASLEEILTRKRERCSDSQDIRKCRRLQK